MLDIETLLDYLIDDFYITIYDLNSERDIEVELTKDEALEWAYKHQYELCSFEPRNNLGITINVCDVEDID